MQNAFRDDLALIEDRVGMKPVLLIVGNDAKYFLSHRLPVAEAARGKGYQVHVATPGGPYVGEICSKGFIHHELPLSRSGTNPFREFKALLGLLKVFWRVRPDIVHLVTIKPVLYGGIAARLSPVGGVLAAVPGLGFIFTASGKKIRLLRKLVSFMYRVALGKRNLIAVFQNPDDQKTLIDLGAITSARSARIRGSGVNLAEFHYRPEQSGVPVVTFAARLLRDKGVLEFVHAAKLLLGRGVIARFQLVGDVDAGNPTSVGVDELNEWISERVVEWSGYSSAMSDVMAQSNLIVLPSYREGLPKVLIEAAASGRAVITTDVPGCRDAIEPNVTGLLVPVKAVEPLADAIQQLLKDDRCRAAMGRAGRTMAEQVFSIESVVEKHLEIYAKLRHNV
ncbi:MAG: glycosyltransferase family 4 protein [Pseudomonas sp.]|uniref:glycosyltransferase family 4 protein n=1 Tax=Pseudomonas TaxID=286 RepID=UPI001EE654BE|nr:glycosyltransferase family 4 protein [Pseudomonas sp. VLB120]